MDPLFDEEPLSKLLQHAFRYGDPILVAAETLEQLKHENKISERDKDVLMRSKWWLAMSTTRVLLAHSIYMDDKHDIILQLITNIRNLLRTLGIDLADKNAYKSIRSNDNIRYQPLNSTGGFWLSLKNKRADVFEGLSTISYDEMNGELVELCKQNVGVLLVYATFGRAVHELVSSRDTGWEKVTMKFKSVVDVKK